MNDKFKSRKFWTAVIANIVGVVTLFCGDQTGEAVSVIAGSLIIIASTLGYLHGEAKIDVEKEKVKYFRVKEKDEKQT